MKVSKQELIKRWETYHSIESDIAAVFDRHKQQDKFEAHLEIARTWRQAVAELKNDLQELELPGKDEGPSWGGLPAKKP